MSEWWSYRPSDFLMFAPRIYWRLFEAQNQTFWPLPLLLPAAALAWLLWFLRGRDAAARVSALGLGLIWLGVAWAFLWQRYAPINWAAEAFAAVFALQGLGLLWAAGIDRPQPIAAVPRQRQVGLALLLWALFGHPLLAALGGRPWSQAEIFGLAPDPTAIGTLGWLLLLGRPAAGWVVPLLWCAISAATLATIGSAQALVPLAAAGLAVGAARRR